MRTSFRIAVIDGDALMRELAGLWLREAGHDVVFLPDAAAVAAVAAAGLDLVVLDVAHPRRAAARVRALRPVPVLLVSAHQRRPGHPASAAAAAALGAGALLAKPYTRDELLAAVGLALGGS